MRALMLVGALGFMLALVLAGCGGSALTITPESAQPPALCERGINLPTLELVESCHQQHYTFDGRECAICAHYSACQFEDPEMGYCADQRYGCSDPACAYGPPK